MSPLDADAIHQALMEAKQLMEDAHGEPLHAIYAPTIERLEDALRRIHHYQTIQKTDE